MNNKNYNSIIIKNACIIIFLLLISLAIFNCSKTPPSSSSNAETSDPYLLTDNDGNFLEGETGPRIERASESTSQYNKFILNTDSVHVSIAQWDAVLAAGTALKIDGDADIKKEAIAMAIGYCVFLNLTNVVDDLYESGADINQIDQIMASMGLNYSLAVGFQETTFNPLVATHSGYFQIDNQPWVLLFNALNPGYGGTAEDKEWEFYKFLYYLNGGATFGSDQGRDAVLCDVNRQGFIWAAVEKGYYDALSYNMNKVPYPNTNPTVPYPGYTLSGWAFQYLNQDGTRTPYQNGDFTAKEYNGTTRTYTAPADGIYIQSYSAMGIILSYFYNRGQNQFASSAAQCLLLQSAIQTNTPIENVFNNYPDYADDAVVYGKRYIWQIPWLFTLLNNGTSIYNERIEQADVLEVLNSLKGFYNGEKINDPAVQAGIDKVNNDDTLVWGEAFNSEDTFKSINSVVVAMMNKSTEITFTDPMKNIITRNSTWAWDPNTINVTTDTQNQINWSLDNFY
ncbi:MAG: hypothetical protein ABIH00_02940 [Armatimonadota bacterium]